jgi:hypothetical protein
MDVSIEPTTNNPRPRIYFPFPTTRAGQTLG